MDCFVATLLAMTALAPTQIVGWAKAHSRRAHHLSSSIVRDGGHASLCPPYDLLRDFIRMNAWGFIVARMSEAICGVRLVPHVASLMRATRTNATSRSRGTKCPSYASSLLPRKERGRGECRMLAAPAGPACSGRPHGTHTSVTTGSAETTGIPRAMVLTAAPCSPWCTGLVSHHRSADHHRKA
jgi:hypothetical protein